jgi:hypothetical protein
MADLRWMLVSTCCCMALGAAGAAVGQEAGARLGRPGLPSRIVNLKAGVTVDALDDPAADEVCRDGVRAAGSFGLQTAFFPFTVAATFQTTVAVELYAGGWWPFARLGPGWMAVSGGLFGRSAMESNPDGEEGCDGSVGTSMDETFGIGASLEYLLLDGYLGFAVDVRQTVLAPASTFVTIGVDVSPLLILVLRRY